MHSDELIKLPVCFSSHTLAGWVMRLIWIYRYINWTGIKLPMTNLPKNQNNSLCLLFTNIYHALYKQLFLVVLYKTSYTKLQCSMIVQNREINKMFKSSIFYRCSKFMSENKNTSFKCWLSSKTLLLELQSW